MISLILLLTVFVPQSSSILFEHAMYLDEEESFHLKWTVNRTTESIQFEVTVETLGWIGLGLSPNGQMPQSDVIIAWVRNGQPFLQDRFAKGRFLPEMDVMQNVDLLSAKEERQRTVVAFSRTIRTCDPQDRAIEVGPTRLIWAYHSRDPASSDAIPRHEKIGWKSANLLTGDSRTDDDELTEDIQSIDLLSNQTMIPSETHTTYWCSVFKLPENEDGYHMIKFDPVIESGHEEFVHHIVVYECPLASDEHVSVSGNCWQSSNMPTSIKRCREAVPIVAWAIGGQGVTFPRDVGYPISGSNGVQYVLMEIHYDNSDAIEGITDSSGIRIYYTSSRPQFHAAILEVGSDVLPLSPLIAPGIKDFVFNTLCAEECTNTGLPDRGIHVFATLLDAHSAGRSLYLRHFRGDEELPEIDRNDNYDFNYQELVRLDKEVEIKQGDILQLVCHYDTSQRTNFTLGGYSTTNEVCLAYLFVYPSPRMRHCRSRPEIKNFAIEAKRKGWIESSRDGNMIHVKIIADMTNSEFSRAYWKFVNETGYQSNCLDYANNRTAPRKTNSLPIVAKPWRRRTSSQMQSCDTTETRTPAVTKPEGGTTAISTGSGPTVRSSSSPIHELVAIQSTVTGILLYLIVVTFSCD